MKKVLFKRVLLSFFSVVFLFICFGCGQPGSDDVQLVGSSGEKLLANSGSLQNSMRGLSVEYKIQNDWGAGFTANVTISNSGGSSVKGWTLTWTFPGNQKITGSWNADVKQSGKKVTAKGSGWTATIPAGGSVSFGFQGTYSGSNGKPSNFTINGNPSTSSSTGPPSSSSTGPNPPVNTYTPNGYGRNATGGGNASPKSVSSGSAFKSAVKGSGRKVIIVQGRINLGGDVEVGSNTTIKGANTSAGLYGGTVRLRGNNYIIQNIDFGPANEDVMEISGGTNVFITKCSFRDSTDELCSIVRGADFVTISWCKFYFNNSTSHSFAHLIGNKDGLTSDRGKLHVTLHHNWYGNGLKGRIPRVRFGHVHIYNNYFNSPGTGYCIGVGKECHIRVENCHFNSVGNIWKNMGGQGNGEIGWKGLLLTGAKLPTFMPNKYPTFSVPYSFSLDSASSVKSQVQSGAGNK